MLKLIFIVDSLSFNIQWGISVLHDMVSFVFVSCALKCSNVDATESIDSRHHPTLFHPDVEL